MIEIKKVIISLVIFAIFKIFISAAMLLLIIYFVSVNVAEFIYYIVTSVAISLIVPDIFIIKYIYDHYINNKDRGIPYVNTREQGLYLPELPN